MKINAIRIGTDVFFGTRIERIERIGKDLKKFGKTLIQRRRVTTVFFELNFVGHGMIGNFIIAYSSKTNLPFLV